MSTDGTPAGTRAVADLPGAPVSLTPAGGGRVLFQTLGWATDSRLWVSDGTTAGTVALRATRPPAYNPVVPTFPGTYVVATSVPVPLPGEPPSSIAPLGNGRFVVPVQDPATRQWQLWSTDGTAAGTVPCFTTGAAPFARLEAFAQPEAFTPVGADRVAFRAGTQAWVTDGTAAGTVLLGPVPGAPASPSSPDAFTPLGAGRFVFQAYDPAHGQELWVSDGTPAGTTPLRDINPGTPGSGISDITAIGGGRAVFQATDAAHGREA